MIFLGGSADMGTARASAADQPVDADESIIARAPVAGLRTLGGPLPPGAGGHFDQEVAVRRPLDDQAGRDPASRPADWPAYDPDDHRHPGDHRHPDGAAHRAVQLGAPR